MEIENQLEMPSADPPLAECILHEAERRDRPACTASGKVFCMLGVMEKFPNLDRENRRRSASARNRVVPHKRPLQFRFLVIFGQKTLTS